MENLKKAVCEVTGLKVKPSAAKKYFYRVYSYLLYQDTAGLLETLDYRQSLDKDEKQHERYYVFRYMLRLLRERHPNHFRTLNPISN
ncbi:hypothetical protein [uncultured Pontibacter sp.]|uniref:hypothetical protein n=1 Tax=uncultured Pontibacter sp. TaxID=453356 RepID=UPI00261CE4C1|nr:hypothetical protein [uncultured Pontibacter sp.]